MKVSSLILITTLCFLVGAMFISNILLRNEYRRIDRSDIYWNYKRVIERPFHHLNIQGSNITNLAYEPSNTYSLRVLKNWRGLEDHRIQYRVSNDTLYTTMRHEFADPYEKDYMKRMTILRVFAPELRSITAKNSFVQMNKTVQSNFRFYLSGKSQVDVETRTHNFDSLFVSQKDSSKVAFRVSADLKMTDQLNANTVTIGDTAAPAHRQEETGLEEKSHSWNRLNFSWVDAHIDGVSILELGHATINDFQLQIADTSAIILSGSTLRKYASIHP